MTSRGLPVGFRAQGFDQNTIGIGEERIRKFFLKKKKKKKEEGDKPFSLRGHLPWSAI
jgi:hypothetical protein